VACPDPAIDAAIVEPLGWAAGSISRGQRRQRRPSAQEPHTRRAEPESSPAGLTE